MDNQNQSSEVKPVSKWNWIIGIFFILVGIGSLSINIAVSIITLLGGIILLPPVAKKIKDKYGYSLSRNMKILFILVIFIFIWTLTSSSIDTSPTVSKQETTKVSRETTSIVFAENVVEGILKSPSTAKFVDVKAYELSNEKDVWVVNGYVDSQNSFSAMIRSMWEVQLDYRDGKGGTVKSILFDGKKIQ